MRSTINNRINYNKILICYNKKGMEMMCRIKRSDTNFDLFVNGKLIKNFKSKTSLDIYIREFEIRNYNIKEGVSSVRSKRLCS